LGFVNISVFIVLVGVMILSPFLQETVKASSTPTAVATILLTGRNPDGAAVNPDTNRIYVVNQSDDNIS